jgi:hypothetical protein
VSAIGRTNPTVVYGVSDTPFNMREEPYTKVIQFALEQIREQ